MAEHTKTISFNSKTAKILVIVLIVGLTSFAVYARATGKSLHIKTGSIKGSNSTVTEYLDNRDDLEGKVTAKVTIGNDTVYIVDGVIAIDVSLVLNSQNKPYPVDHFIRGDIGTGTRIKAVVQKSDPLPSFSSYGITNWFKVWPADPFYIAAE